MQKSPEKKLDGGKRMKHREIADDISAVSSIHSNATRVLRERMPTKPKRPVITAPPKPPAEVTSEPVPLNQCTLFSKKIYAQRADLQAESFQFPAS